MNKDEQKRIEKTLSSLTKREEKQLKLMLKQLFLYSELSYTLFGNKPMSFTLIYPIKEIEEGVIALEKILPNFNKNGFAIFNLNMNNHPTLLIANKELVYQTYIKEKEHLKDKTNDLQTIKEALNEGGDKLIALLENDLLAGTLLGYGANNAKLWTEYNYAAINKHSPLKPFAKGHMLYYYLKQPFPVSFACDPSTTETKDLKKLYANDRYYIKKLFRSKKLFEHIILKLTD